MKAEIFTQKACEQCHRTPHVANNRPHSLHRTKRIVELNLQRTDGKMLCTRCRRTTTKFGGHTQA